MSHMDEEAGAAADREVSVALGEGSSETGSEDGAKQPRTPQKGVEERRDVRSEAQGATSSAGGLVGMVGPVLDMSRHLRGQRRLFLTVLLTVWAELVLSMATAVLSVAAASALAATSAGYAGRLLLALCACVLALGVLAWFEQWFAHVLAYRVIDVVRLRIHRAIARLAPLGLARRRSGETVSAAMADAESLEWFYAHTVAQVLAGAFAALAVSGLALIWLGPLAIIIPATQALVVLVPVLLLPRAARQGAELRSALADLSAQALEARACARETVLLGRLEAESAQIAEHTRQVQAARRALALRTGVEQALIEAASVGLVLSSLVLAGSASERGGLAPGLVPVVVCLAGISLLPATAITGALSRLGETSSAARRVDALIRTPGIRPLAPEEQTGPFSGGPDPDPGSVRVRDLRVRYPDTDAPVLDGLDLDVEAGQMLAIVGSSGAGKTTLALSLARLIAQESGRILIDGVDSAGEAPERTRERLILVGQHPHVFRASVRDNLLSPEASSEQVWEALERSRLADRVRALPEGLETVLAERGAAWSGGERQRLGLARGLVRDPGVLVLDEPTAGLDTRTEAEFLRTLARGRRGRTTIIVTHRRAVMSACDRVALLHGGRVAATGTHEELLACSELYRCVLEKEPTATVGSEARGGRESPQ